jgi:hypothetical protein
MCLDPMGMIWMQDVMAHKPAPTNIASGLIYMLNGATQHSYTDPFDRTSPAIPIGPHWMILWPFDATTAGPCFGSVLRLQQIRRGGLAGSHPRIGGVRE